MTKPFKVIYDPQEVIGYDRESADLYLVLGKEYTVTGSHKGFFHDYFNLKEAHSKCFNQILFRRVK